MDVVYLSIIDLHWTTDLHSVAAKGYHIGYINVAFSLLESIGLFRSVLYTSVMFYIFCPDGCI